MSRLLENKVALVTAGVSGIGRAISTALAEHGAAVAVHYRTNKDGAVALATSLADAGVRSTAVHADLRDAIRTRAAIQEAEAALGPLDILVNNASIYLPPRPVEFVPWENMQSEFEGSVQTAFNATQAALTGMLARGQGRILFLVGTMVQRPAAGYAAHAAGKGALLAFARAVARETASRGVTVHCLSPGMVLTPGVLESVSYPEREALRVKTPTRRLSAPEDVARLAVFLASDLASCCTSLHLNADGGLADLGG